MEIDKITDEMVADWAKANKKNVLDNYQLKSIREESQSLGYTKAKTEFEPSVTEAEEAKQELETFKLEKMSETEKSQHSLDTALLRLEEEKLAKVAVEKRLVETNLQYASERRNTELVDRLGSKSLDPAMSVRECLYKFPNLEMDGSDLVIKEGDKVTDPKETSVLLNTWFDSKTILHKQTDSGLNLPNVIDGGADSTKGYNPRDPATKTELNVAILKSV